MAAQPLSPHSDKPFWQVRAVSDPEGKGQDFAYTIGLATVGLPEIHLFARPSLGSDPAPDWKLSHHDLGRILNDFAAMAMRGELAVGTTFGRDFDGGLTRASFRVDPPEDPVLLEALGVPRGADVVPVRWSLHRAPTGTLAPLSPEWLAWARSEYAVAAARVPTYATMPGWVLPEVASFEPDQRFGPLTPLVVATAAALTRLSSDELVSFSVLAACADRCGALRLPPAMTQALARRVGRSAAAEAAHMAAHDVGDWLRSKGRRWHWDAFLSAWDPEVFCGRDRRRKTEDGLSGLLHDALLSLLMTQVVADAAPDDLLLMGLGPWLVSRAGDVHDPEQWQTSRALADALARRPQGVGTLP